MWHSKGQTSALTPSLLMQGGNANFLPTSSISSQQHHQNQSESGFSASIRTQPSSMILPQHQQQSQPPAPPQTTQQHPPKMVYRLKSLVSKKKKRFQADGFDLDLSYISARIIAMGFPAERIEGLYRNHIDEVSRFFEQRHKGHYKIYHLCNERDFNEYRFSGPVVRYPFSDHNAPQFEQILALCRDVMEFLNAHPENVVAINCKAGKGRTGVMVCACLMELQEARNAEEALRLYAEKRTRNGQGVTIPSQRRYVQYYSRLLSSSLTYVPTPLRLTSIRIEGLPHQLHGVQNFELSISTYQNRLSVNNHNHHDPTACSEDPSVHTAQHHQQQPPVSPCGASTGSVNPLLTTIGGGGIVSVGMTPQDSGPIPNATLDYDCHRHSDVTTYQIPCSTHHSDNGSYLIRLDEPVTVFEDFRIKIKARTGGGVLTKKIGQCWLNTFFVLLDNKDGVGSKDCGPDCGPSSVGGNGASATNTAINSTNVGRASSTGDCCSTSDSNSGSGSSSDSSASSSSTSSSVRSSPPHFAHHDEDHELYVGEDFGGSPDPQEHLDDSIDEEEDESGDGGEEEDEEEEVPAFTSNSATLNTPTPSNPTPTPEMMTRRASNPPPRFGAITTAKNTTAGGSMPFISIPKKEGCSTTLNNNGSAAHPKSTTLTSNFTKKSSPNASLTLAPPLSTQLATPLAVRVLELSQSDLDAAIKTKGKKGEEFKILFEFVRETPVTGNNTSTTTSTSTTSATGPINSVMTTSSSPAVNVLPSALSNTPCLYPYHHQRQIPMEVLGVGVDEIPSSSLAAAAAVVEQKIVDISACLPSNQLHQHHRHPPHDHPFRSPAHESTPNHQTGALVL